MLLHGYACRQVGARHAPEWYMSRYSHAWGSNNATVCVGGVGGGKVLGGDSVHAVVHQSPSSFHQRLSPVAIPRQTITIHMPIGIASHTCHLRRSKRVIGEECRCVVRWYTVTMHAGGQRCVLRDKHRTANGTSPGMLGSASGVGVCRSRWATGVMRQHSAGLMLRVRVCCGRRNTSAKVGENAAEVSNWAEFCHRSHPEVNVGRNCVASNAQAGSVIRLKRGKITDPRGVFAPPGNEHYMSSGGGVAGKGHGCGGVWRRNAVGWGRRCGNQATGSVVCVVRCVVAVGTGGRGSKGVVCGGRCGGACVWAGVWSVWERV